MPTSADVTLARLELNAEIRSCDRRSANQRWTARAPIPPSDRAAFRSAVAAERALQHHKITAGRTTARPLSKTKRATVARRAVRNVLVARGELIINWSNASSSGEPASVLSGN